MIPALAASLPAAPRDTGADPIPPAPDDGFAAAIGAGDPRGCDEDGGKAEALPEETDCAGMAALALAPLPPAVPAPPDTPVSATTGTGGSALCATTMPVAAGEAAGDGARDAQTAPPPGSAPAAPPGEAPARNTPAALALRTAAATPLSGGGVPDACPTTGSQIGAVVAAAITEPPAETAARTTDDARDILPDPLPGDAAEGDVAAAPVPAAEMGGTTPDGAHPGQHGNRAAPATMPQLPPPAAPHPGPATPHVSVQDNPALPPSATPGQIVMSTPELGSLVMNVAQEDGALALTFAADRADTLDLLRRNIDLLARDLRDMGFAGASFGFHRQGDGRAGSSAPQLPPVQSEIPDGGPSPAVLHGGTGAAPAAVAGGLNIRL